MNLIVLIASLGGGGAERMALRLAKGLNDNMHKTCLITIDGSRDYNDAESTRLSASSVTWPTILKVFFIPWQKMRLNHIIKNRKIDGVVSFMERANMMNLSQDLVKNRIISIRTHSTMMMKAKSPLKRSLVKMGYKRMLNKARKVVCNSLEMKLDFEKLYNIDPDKVKVIYNFCDSLLLGKQAKEPIPEDMKQAFKKPVIITSGRMDNQKGQWHLIKAFKLLCSRFKDLNLIILGKGPLKKMFTKMCCELDMEDRIFFPGFVQNPFTLISKAKIFILPSLWEGFPNALLEAMAVGTPVIAADCSSGPGELLLPETDPRKKTDISVKTPYGILLPPLEEKINPLYKKTDRSAQVIADAVSQMLNDERYLFSCAQGVLERAQDFTPELIVEQWINLIRKTP